MATIHLNSSHRLLDDFNNISIVLASVAISIQYLQSGSAIYNHGDYAALDGKCGESIRIPLHGPVQVAMTNQYPSYIDIVIEGNTGVQNVGQQRIAGLNNAIDGIISPYFVNFYEKHQSDARNHFGTTYDIWPSEWRIGWVLRNAFAHDGKVHYRNLNTPSVIWRGITVSPANQGEVVMRNIADVADLLILLIDMDNVLP